MPKGFSFTFKGFRTVFPKNPVLFSWRMNLRFVNIPVNRMCESYKRNTSEQIELDLKRSAEFCSFLQKTVTATAAQPRTAACQPHMKSGVVHAPLTRIAYRSAFLVTESHFNEIFQDSSARFLRRAALCRDRECNFRARRSACPEHYRRRDCR